MEARRGARHAYGRVRSRRKAGSRREGGGVATYDEGVRGGSVARGGVTDPRRLLRAGAPWLVAGGAAVYFAAFSLLRQQWASLLIFAPVFIAAAALGRVRAFMLTWLPLAVFMDGFARLRALADETPLPTHYTAPIAAERWLFGVVPTLWLQARLTAPSRFRWYDYAATFVHWSHFVVPVLILVVLWLRYPALFRRYALAFVALTAIVLGIYFLFPAAPPWLASRDGYLPYVARPMVAIAMQVNRSLFGAVYATIGATNDVAAMPSLHAAYPFLMFIMLWPVSRRWGMIGLAYFAVMGFSLVYLGEHYVVDIIAAALGAFLARTIASAIDRRLPPLPARRALREPKTRAALAASRVPARAA